MFFVAEAVAQILGTAEKIIKSGSTLQLHCILKRATEEPLYVFWYVQRPLAACLAGKEGQTNFSHLIIGRQGLRSTGCS